MHYGTDRSDFVQYPRGLPDARNISSCGQAALKVPPWRCVLHTPNRAHCPTMVSSFKL